jgi:hypothetical protein
MAMDPPEQGKTHVYTVVGWGRIARGFSPEGREVGEVIFCNTLNINEYFLVCSGRYDVLLTSKWSA